MVEVGTAQKTIVAILRVEYHAEDWKWNPGEEGLIEPEKRRLRIDVRFYRKELWGWKLLRERVDTLWFPKEEECWQLGWTIRETVDKLYRLTGRWGVLHRLNLVHAVRRAFRALYLMGHDALDWGFPAGEFVLAEDSGGPLAVLRYGVLRPWGGMWLALYLYRSWSYWINEGPLRR